MCAFTGFTRHPAPFLRGNHQSVLCSYVSVCAFSDKQFENKLQISWHFTLQWHLLSIRTCFYRITISALHLRKLSHNSISSNIQFVFKFPLWWLFLFLIQDPVKGSHLVMSFWKVYLEFPSHSCFFSLFFFWFWFFNDWLLKSLDQLPSSCLTFWIFLTLLLVAFNLFLYPLCFLQMGS